MSKAIVKSTPTSYLLGRQHWHFKSIEAEWVRATYHQQQQQQKYTEPESIWHKRRGTKKSYSYFGYFHYMSLFSLSFLWPSYSNGFRYYFFLFVASSFISSFGKRYILNIHLVWPLGSNVTVCIVSTIKCAVPLSARL